MVRRDAYVDIAVRWREALRGQNARKENVPVVQENSLMGLWQVDGILLFVIGGRRKITDAHHFYR